MLDKAQCDGLGQPHLMIDCTCCRPTAVVDAEGGVGMLTCLAPDSSFQVLDLASLLPLIAEVGQIDQSALSKALSSRQLTLMRMTTRMRLDASIHGHQQPLTPA